MTETTKNAKRMAQILNHVAEEDEISIFVNGEHYHGAVSAVEDGSAEDIERCVTMDDGSYKHQIHVRYTGPDDEHRITDADDFEIFVTDLEREYEVTAVATWTGPEVPDMTLDEFEDEKREELEEGLEEELKDFERALTELKAFRNSVRGVLANDMTMAELEKEMRMVEMESGGRLVLDKR